MKTDNIKKIVNEIKKEFYDVDFENGDCLNLAIALQGILSHFGYKSDVVPVMRYSEFDITQVIFSHAVLLPYLEQDNPSLSDTIDINGDNAYDRWVTSFNANLRRINRKEVRFWCNKPPFDSEEFARDSESFFGNKKENLLVDKPDLRKKITEYGINLLTDPNF